jgi:hypothetical protein
MSHLDERVLEKLVTATASASEVDRIRRHVAGCRPCARRLEEWRDNFAEVDHSYPELTEDDRSSATLTAGGLVLVPTRAAGRRLQLDFANLLWVIALVMAVVVVYGAHRLRSAKDGFSAIPTVRRPVAFPPESGNGAGAPIPLAQPSDSLIRVAQRSAPPPATGVQQTPATTPRPAADLPRPQAEPATKPKPDPGRSMPAHSAATTPEPSPAPEPVAQLPVSPRFRAVPVAEATQRLGGPLRLLRGLDPDHVEVGPASAVPGAQAGLNVIRVVYRAPDGGRMLLDQQLIPADSSGFRPIDDPALESGQTAFGTAATGVSVATWLDEDGYRISLVAQAPVDSLRRLVPLVR